jgi:hypothetical protein
VTFDADKIEKLIEKLGSSIEGLYEKLGPSIEKRIERLGSSMRIPFFFFYGEIGAVLVYVTYFVFPVTLNGRAFASVLIFDGIFWPFTWGFKLVFVLLLVAVTNAVGIGVLLMYVDKAKAVARKAAGTQSELTQKAAAQAATIEELKTELEKSEHAMRMIIFQRDELLKRDNADGGRASFAEPEILPPDSPEEHVLSGEQGVGKDDDLDSIYG